MRADQFRMTNSQGVHGECEWKWYELSVGCETRNEKSRRNMVCIYYIYIHIYQYIHTQLSQDYRRECKSGQKGRKFVYRRGAPSWSNRTNFHTNINLRLSQIKIRQTYPEISDYSLLESGSKRKEKLSSSLKEMHPVVHWVAEFYIWSFNDAFLATETS